MSIPIKSFTLLPSIRSNLTDCQVIGSNLIIHQIIGSNLTNHQVKLEGCQRGAQDVARIECGVADTFLRCNSLESETLGSSHLWEQGWDVLKNNQYYGLKGVPATGHFVYIL